jgi:hypothetical protein
VTIITAWKIQREGGRIAITPVERESFSGKVAGAVISLASQVSIVHGVGTMLNKKEGLSFG